MTLPYPCLCLITDRHRLLPDARTERDELVALERFLDGACEAGIDLIQLRERDLNARAFVELIARVTRRAPAGVRLVVNDRADVAHAGRAAGVHLPADAPPVARVRAIGPAGWIVGRSVHVSDPEIGALAARLPAVSGRGAAASDRGDGPPMDRAAGSPTAGPKSAAAGGALANAESERPSLASLPDYLIFGTVFPTSSKPAGAPVAGLDGLRATVAAVSTAPAPTAAARQGAIISPARVPVLAIGGITPARAAACREAGAAGLAAIGAFLPPGRAPEALGPREAARAFRQAWSAAAGPR